ncbi:hypothetical protein BHE74_00018564 [Ensete ventricosum]|nr:hypothetical protein BHE74_00018564 [Ensete ventricosum]
MGPRREFARRFAEGIGKLARSTLGNHRRRRMTYRKNDKGFGLHPKKIGSGHRCASRRRTREWTYITLSTLFISMTLWHDQRLLGTLAESKVITLGLAKRCKAESNNLSAMEVAFMQPRVVATWGPWRQGFPGR